MGIHSMTFHDILWLHHSMTFHTFHDILWYCIAHCIIHSIVIPYIPFACRVSLGNIDSSVTLTHGASRYSSLQDLSFSSSFDKLWKLRIFKGWDEVSCEGGGRLCRFCCCLNKIYQWYQEVNNTPYEERKSATHRRSQLPSDPFHVLGGVSKSYWNGKRRFFSLKTAAIAPKKLTTHTVTQSDLKSAPKTTSIRISLMSAE